MKSLPVESLYEKYPKLLKLNVDTILEWLKRQPHLPELTEFEVAVFLQVSDYSIEAAKTRLDSFYTIRTLLPGCFGSRDILGADVAAMKEVA